jgi:hypothetical protein
MNVQIGNFNREMETTRKNPGEKLEMKAKTATI